MGLPEVLAGTMLGALVLYAILGGADFGGGIWDLLASGPRARDQRALIDRAIAPVWEANHVWLVLIVVVLFTAFPAAFSAASVWLHLPLTLMLFGVVLRGSAFVFKTYDPRGKQVQRRWDRLFAVSSVVTPFFLGVSLGAVTSGHLDAERVSDGDFIARFVLPWIQPFPLLVGGFALCIFAFLSAVYLTIEASDAKLQDDFRKRALVAGAATAALAAATAVSGAFLETSPVDDEVLGAWWLWVIVPAAILAWLQSLRALFIRRYRAARIGAVVFVMLVLGGWGLGQYPYLVSPDITIRSAAAPESTLRALVIALAAGALVLFPSLIWLLRVFKRREVFSTDGEKKD